ncbi:MAG TPA: N-acetylmuramic acid 6-phosphate etherase, partial [Mariniflexile sp.]|nr:N-acetylmuramic acid 6-phosphate etherase [Mariniflexile sp.]
MAKKNPDTERESLYSNLDKMSTNELLSNINKEDKKVADIIEEQIPNIEKLVDVIVSKMKLGGRLFYIGAGTSGRIGILDASECPPTFGVPDNWIIGLIAGGDSAIRKAVENAEDDIDQAWRDLSAYD